MSTALVGLAVFLLPWLLGSGLMRLFDTPRAMGAERLARIAQAWSTGFLVFGVVLWLFAWFALPVPGALQLGLFAALGLLSHALASQREEDPEEAPAPRPRHSRLEWSFFAAAVLVSLASLSDRANLARLAPITSGDEAAIWTAAARGLHASGGYTGEYAHAIATTITHPDYPALNPLWQNFVFDLAGGPDPFNGRLPMQAGALALMLLVAGSLAHRTRPAIAAVAALAIAGLHGGAHLDLVQTAYSDGLVALGLALATVAWIEWQERRRTASLLLAAAGLALAVFAKNEGLMHAAAFIGAAALTRGPHRPTERELLFGPPSRLAPALLLLAFVPAALTYLVQSRFALEGDMTGTANAAGAPIWETIPSQFAERAPLVLDYLARHLFLSPTSGGFLLLALGLALLAKPKALLARKLAAPTLMILLSSLGFTLIFIGSVHHLGRGPGAELWHLDTALVRVFAQLVPAATILVALSLGSEDEPGENPSLS